MKRIVALTLAVLMVAALFCACGEKKSEDTASSSASSAEEPKEVKAVVDSKYDNGFAEKYAKSVTTDEDGNKVYEFDNQSYKEYTRNYNNQISASITTEVVKNHDSKFGQYCYLNDDKKAVIVCVNPGMYDEASASKEAEGLAQMSFSYFKGLEDSIDTVSVIYCNANDQEEVYGKFDFPIE